MKYSINFFYAQPENKLRLLPLSDKLNPPVMTDI